MRLIVFLLLSSISFFSLGQARTIKGKVVYDIDFTSLPGTKIHDSDTLLLGIAGENGNFEIQLPSGTDELLLSFIGMEWTSVKVPKDCNNLEIIMIADGTYDFTPARKVNRRRYRLFKDLPNKHHQAHERGIFTSDTPCGVYIFRKY